MQFIAMDPLFVKIPPYYYNFTPAIAIFGPFVDAFLDPGLVFYPSS